jgi:hypothetical protein
MSTENEKLAAENLALSNAVEIPHRRADPSTFMFSVAVLFFFGCSCLAFFYLIWVFFKAPFNEALLAAVTTAKTWDERLSSVLVLELPTIISIIVAVLAAFIGFFILRIAGAASREVIPQRDYAYL